MQFAVSQEKEGQRLLKGIEIPKLTVKEQEVYQYIRSRYDDLLDQLNEARAIVGKTPINKVENYMTHIRDLNILEQMGFSPITDDIETLLANKVHRNTTAFQWAKRRFNALDDIEWDALNVFRKYQEKALNHINLTPAIVKVRELSRTIIPDSLLVDRQIATITTKIPEAKFRLLDQAPRAFKYISEWTDFVAGQKVQNNIPPVVENVLNKLNQNVAFATLSGNIRSAIIQIGRAH